MIFYSTLFSTIILDLSSKYLFFHFLDKKINIINDFFYLDVVKNTGVAFSLNLPFIKIITLVLIIAIFYYYFKEEKFKKKKIIDISFGLILGGAIGNGLERIFLGSVTDFIGIKYFSVFNFADIAIFIGAMTYIFYLFKTKK